MKMSEHRYDIRISENCVDPNPLMVERQDPDNFTCLQTRERCTLEIAVYVFKFIIWRSAMDWWYSVRLVNQRVASLSLTSGGVALLCPG